MRTRILLFVVVLLIFGGYVLVRWQTKAHNAAPLQDVIASASAAAPTKVDFSAEVRPILARCTPCHFSGGKMYEKLPFDRPETVKKLGEKLFSRIQAENDRKIIREFLAQNEETSP
jgi:hypothetical protein